MKVEMSIRCVEPEETGDCIIEVEHRHWLFWWKRVKRTFRGTSTVWHDVKTGQRPGTEWEHTLCGCWQRLVWKLRDEYIKKKKTRDANFS
jgi:hypothetical protein